MLGPISNTGHTTQSYDPILVPNIYLEFPDILLHDTNSIQVEEKRTTG
jgi:hypothetical protein